MLSKTLALLAALASFNAFSTLALAQEDDQLPADFLATVTPLSADSLSDAAGGGVLGRSSTASALGVDSVRNWSSYFYRFGFNGNGATEYTWPYTMVGRSPFGGDDNEGDDEEGHISAPVVPVTLDLRNADGTPRFVNGQPLISKPDSLVNSVLASPIFQNSPYSSSADPTQFTDAVMRAEFFKVASKGWHTMLHPSVKTGRTMVLLKGTYQFSLNRDGSCCLFVLVNRSTFVNALIPPGPADSTTVVGQAEISGDIRTADISTFLFPNTFLFVTNTMNCCILGFHTYDLEAGDASNGWKERRFVINYSSWVTGGLFRDPKLADVSVLSHELAETFNDPFVNNRTPWWLAPNGLCQENLETGDVIEGLPNEIDTIVLKGVSYHVQNEALLQWFAGESPSSAVGGAYSYPDPTVLPTPSTSQKPRCAP